MSTENVRIEWTPELSIDKGAIDDDHKYLFKLVNDFVSKGRCFKSAEEAYDLIRQMTEYASIHFRREEKLQQQINFPHAEAHKIEHARIEDALAEIQRMIISTKASQIGIISEKTGNLVSDWLVTHISEFDLPMKYFIDLSPQESEDTPSIDDLTLL